MFEFLMVVLFVWLFFKGIGLMFKVAWGAAKIIAILLSVLALPVLIGGLVLAGGVILLLPVALVAGAVGILKCCA